MGVVEQEYTSTYFDNSNLPSARLYTMQSARSSVCNPVLLENVVALKALIFENLCSFQCAALQNERLNEINQLWLSGIRLSQNAFYKGHMFTNSARETSRRKWKWFWQGEKLVKPLRNCQHNLYIFGTSQQTPTPPRFWRRIWKGYDNATCVASFPPIGTNSWVPTTQRFSSKMAMCDANS